MTDSERLLLIREALEIFKSRSNTLSGIEIEDYVDFIDRVEIALADRIEVVF